MEQKGYTPMILLIGVVVITSIVGGAYFFGKLPIKPTDNNPKACTLEAKICPDGSVVGRSGPNCEFTQCPEVAPTKSADEIANWKTYTNEKYSFSFKHPDLTELTNTNYPGGSIEKLLVDMHRDIQQIPGTTAYYQDSLLIDLFDNQEGISLESYVEFRRRRGDPAVEKELSIIIGGQRGIMQKLRFENTIEYFVKFPNNNNVLTIVRKDAKTNSFQKDFDQILSTFKFLDQNQVTPGSDQTSCTTVNDCGVNTCGCTAMRKEFLGKNTCMMACSGEIKCLNNKCVLD